MNSFLKLIGADSQIMAMPAVTKVERDKFVRIGVMAGINISGAFISGLMIGMEAGMAWWAMIIAATALGGFWGIFQGFLLNVFDHSHASVNTGNQLDIRPVNASDWIRISIIVLFATFLLQGLKLYFFSGAITTFCQKLEQGQLSPQLLDLTKEEIKQGFHQSWVHQLAMVNLIYQGRPLVLWTFYTAIISVFTMPVLIKTFDKSVRYGAYEYLRYRVETDLIKEEYEASEALRIGLLWEHFEVTPEKYEAFEDAPFNTKRIYPPRITEIHYDQETKSGK
ncbi:MAG: hypothetical protein U0X91_27755 [Spirosomataceae bacterium]